MDIPSKDVVKKRIIFTWRNAKQASQNVKETMSKPHKFYSTLKGSFFLTLEGMRAFSKIIDELKKVEGVTLKFSDKYLERIVDNIIVTLLPAEEKEIESASEKQVDNLFMILTRSAVNWRIIVPIVNLELEMDDLRVGKVRFFKFADAAKNQLQSEIKKSTLGSPNELISSIEEDLEKNYVGKVCVEVIVSAVDSERAKDIGMQTIDMALDALRFYRLNHSFRDPFIFKNYFDVQGKIHSGNQVTILLENYPTLTGLSVSYENKGFMVPFTITKAALKKIRIDSFDSLSDILQKDERNRTDFEKDLVTAIRFCALSTRDEPITNAFVNSVISLEAVLLDEHEAIVDNLAERVAFIIGRNSNERNWLFDQMKRLYRLRSSIVHSGNTDIQRSDLELLQRLINYRCIVNLLSFYQSKNIRKIRDLITWIRHQKFS